LTELKNIRHFALDMDGTMYRGENWVDGALDFLHKLEETGRDYVFLTNNSSKSRAGYLQKLSRLGLLTAPERMLTSGRAAIRYIKIHYPGMKVFLLGNDSLCQEFSEAGIVLDRRNPDMVVTAFNPSLVYKDLQDCCDLVREGLPYIATHPDANCPTETGLMPDIGATHAFIHVSAGRWPDAIAGKPHRAMADYLFAATGWEPSQTAAVGDRLTTDVALGLNHGFTGVLVLSGATRREELDEPGAAYTMVFESVKEIIEYL
jgi:HAD superfamily hydrolase (TIGR01450 family)